MFNMLLGCSQKEVPRKWKNPFWTAALVIVSILPYHLLVVPGYMKSTLNHSMVKTHIFLVLDPLSDRQSHTTSRISLWANTSKLKEQAGRWQQEFQKKNPPIRKKKGIQSIPRRKITCYILMGIIHRLVRLVDRPLAIIYVVDSLLETSQA